MMKHFIYVYRIQTLKKLFYLRKFNGNTIIINWLISETFYWRLDVPVLKKHVKFRNSVSFRLLKHYTSSSKKNFIIQNEIEMIFININLKVIYPFNNEIKCIKKSLSVKRIPVSRRLKRLVSSDKLYTDNLSKIKLRLINLIVKLKACPDITWHMDIIKTLEISFRVKDRMQVNTILTGCKK